MDLLDALVQRNLGRAGLRPRLMPAFEAPVVEETVFAPPRAAAVHPSEPLAPPSVPQPLRHELGEIRGLSQPSPESLTESTKVAEENAKGLEGVVHERSSLASPRPPETANPVTVERHVVEEVSRTFERASHTHEREEISTLTQVVETLAPRAVPALRPSSLAPVLTPGDPKPVAQSPESSGIEIHIGRVEVRAQFAPAPRREPPKPKAPALSLERYLEERR